MILNYNTAKDKLLASDINGCLQFFKDNGYLLESAYCELLNDNLNNAMIIFQELKDYDIRADWGLFLTKLISGESCDYPTYLQLRNFLEIDLDILIKHAKGDYVEKIIKYADWMFTINPEVHKFIGRVLINNGIEVQGRLFLLRAKDYFYQDPELHFLLAVEFLKENEIQQAQKAIKACLEVLPGYFPAVNMQKNLGFN